MNLTEIFKDTAFGRVKRTATEEEMEQIRRDAEKKAEIQMAATFGNRRTRRHRFDGLERPRRPITSEERKRRNKANKIAAQSRRINRK